MRQESHAIRLDASLRWHDGGLMKPPSLIGLIAALIVVVYLIYYLLWT